MIIEFWFVIIGFIGAIIEFTFFFYNITVDGIDVLDTDAVDENVEDENVENEEDDDEDNNILKYKKKTGFIVSFIKCIAKFFIFTSLFDYNYKLMKLINFVFRILMDNDD